MSFKEEKFKEDNKKLKKLPTSIYTDNEKFNKNVENFIPSKSNIELNQIDPNKSYGKWIYFREVGSWIMD